MGAFENYKQAYDYFYGKENHYWDLGLENIRNFLKQLDSPQEKLKIIQIAGTNGKGSVSAFLTDILKENKYKTGRYNSPVVFEPLENISINGENMPEEKFTELVNQMYSAMEKADSEGILPTIFELETAMAIQYFANEKCNLVILEAGLGGEKDATNVSEKNELAVFTSISLDHMKYLGNNHTRIAEVKSGIIKSTKAAVVGVNPPEVTEVIKNRAEKSRAEFYSVKQSNIEILQNDLNGQRFSYITDDCIRFENIRILMLGKNQAENAALAIEAAMALKKIGFRISRESIYDGLAKTIWPGRFQVIKTEPVVILDGAHNPDAVRRLLENIDDYLSGYNIIYIVGIFRDKDYDGIIDIMSDRMMKVVTVTTPNPRSMDAEKLKNVIIKKNPGADVKAAASISDAVRTALSESNKKSAIIAFGSLSSLKSLKEGIQEAENENR